MTEPYESGTGVQIKGLGALVRDLKAASVSVADLKEAFSEVAQKAERYAEAGVPVRTGRLRDSIRPSKSVNKAVVRAGGAKVPYAGAINYGWRARHIEANGFLTHAANDHADEYVDTIEAALGRVLARYGLL